MTEIRSSLPRLARFAPALLAGVMLAIGLAAYGLGTGQAAAQGTETPVIIQGFAFQPDTITVTVGSTVRWTNMDNVQHTSTSDTGAWDSPLLSQNQSFTFTFTTAGTFPYHCTPHPNMRGTIVVLAAAQATPSPAATGTATAGATAAATATSTVAATQTAVVSTATPSPAAAVTVEASPTVAATATVPVGVEATPTTVPTPEALPTVEVLPTPTPIDIGMPRTGEDDNSLLGLIALAVAVSLAAVTAGALLSRRRGYGR